MIPLSHYLVLSGLLFGIGAAGVLLRRNALVVLMSLELMMNGVNVSLVAFSSYLHSLDGWILVFFVIAVSAAEVGIGLALLLVLFAQRGTIQVDRFNLLKW
ncbi:MAG: NADH-quinone oxidoreductase subunit NuoK [Dehalococcoidia bacterium]